MGKLIPWPNGSFREKDMWRANVMWGYCVTSTFSRSRKWAYLKALFNVVLYRPYACEWVPVRLWRGLWAKFSWM